MEPTTNTIAYTLRVPSTDPSTMADTLVAAVVAARDAGTPITLTGSHVTAGGGAVRFRMADDHSAIRLASSIPAAETPGSTLTSGFGVHSRLIAES